MTEDFETRTERRLNDHAERIRELEICDASQKERIDALCERLAALTKTLEQWMAFAQTLFWKVLGLAGGIIGVLAGFFIWYIQHLPTK